jgi:hypothetical protein
MYIIIIIIINCTICTFPTCFSNNHTIVEDILIVQSY